VLRHDKCLCMRAYVEHCRVDTQQAQEPIGAAKCWESCSCPWQPRPQEGYAAIQGTESRMGLADTHQWTGPAHKRARCWRRRWWWHWLLIDSVCVCVCVCIYICIYVYVYISVYITSAYMYMYQRVRLRSSHAGLQWHVPCCMHTILVYHCNKQTSNVFLSIQFDTNVSQLLRHVLPWSYDPLPSLGELSWSSLNRLSVCLSCLFWLCNPPVVYRWHILCLRCLRVPLFFHFF